VLRVETGADHVRRVTPERPEAEEALTGGTRCPPVEGVPAGLPLTEDVIAIDLARRQKGYGRGARQAIEQDRAEILGGVRHGRLLGSPILPLARHCAWETWTAIRRGWLDQIARLPQHPGRSGLALLADLQLPLLLIDTPTPPAGRRWRQRLGGRLRAFNSSLLALLDLLVPAEREEFDEEVFAESH